MSQRIDRKQATKQAKLASMLPHLDGSSSAGRVLAEDMERRFQAETEYGRHKKRELQALLEEISTGGMPSWMRCVPCWGKWAQTGVHPQHFQRELGDVSDKLGQYRKKL